MLHFYLVGTLSQYVEALVQQNEIQGEGDSTNQHPSRKKNEEIYLIGPIGVHGEGRGMEVAESEVREEREKEMAICLTRRREPSNR